MPTELLLLLPMHGLMLKINLFYLHYFQFFKFQNYLIQQEKYTSNVQRQKSSRDKEEENFETCS